MDNIILEWDTVSMIVAMALIGFMGRLISILQKLVTVVERLSVTTEALEKGSEDHESRIRSLERGKIYEKAV